MLGTHYMLVDWCRASGKLLSGHYFPIWSIVANGQLSDRMMTNDEATAAAATRTDILLFLPSLFFAKGNNVENSVKRAKT